MSSSAIRFWDYWTQAKLDLLRDYLDAFVRASSGQRERIYLDAFAGQGAGFSRATREEFKGSARIAIETRAPGFTKVRLFEKGRRAEELRQTLAQDYPGRDVLVYEGDCNETIPVALAQLVGVRWAPTFAFLDPDGMQLAWDTLRVLADHKRGYRWQGSSKREYKVELWMLFPIQGLVRSLALEGGPLDESDARRATRLFGVDDWRPTYELRRAGLIDGKEARGRYLNLMRWRLESELGYSETHPLEVKNSQGASLYYMILATDHEAGARIITDLYGKAAGAFPAMRQAALDRSTGQGSFAFGPPSPVKYRYEPPWRP